MCVNPFLAMNNLGHIPSAVGPNRHNCYFINAFWEKLCIQSWKMGTKASRISSQVASFIIPPDLCTVLHETHLQTYMNFIKDIVYKFARYWFGWCCFIRKYFFVIKIYFVYHDGEFDNATCIVTWKHSCNFAHACSTMHYHTLNASSSSSEESPDDRLNKKRKTNGTW